MFKSPMTLDLLCGIDEAGRGPWAGPVTAAAVILDPSKPIAGLTDSKKLSEKKRDALAILIRENALAFAVAHASHEEIDEINIRQATHLAMRRAAQALSIAPSHALIDGNDAPSNFPCTTSTIIKGDLTEPAISAASILAKTERDNLMKAYDDTYPGYGFAGHKGYGTATHSSALGELGPCPIHRKSFAPVARAAQNLPKTDRQLQRKAS